MHCSVYCQANCRNPMSVFWHGPQAVLILLSTHRKARTFKWFALKKAFVYQFYEGHIPCWGIVKQHFKPTSK